MKSSIVKEEVIPIYLDDTPIQGIPTDVVGIRFKMDMSDGWQDRAEKEIVFKVIDRLD